jgi:cell division protein FtsW
MPTRGQVLQWSVVAMLALAALMVQSAALGVGAAQFGFLDLLTGRPVIYAALAIGAMFFAARIDVRGVYQTRSIFNPVPWLVPVAIGLCVIVLVPSIGAEINSSRRWLAVGPASWRLTFQPSELAKWITVIALAWWLARRAGAMRHLFAGLVPPLTLLAIICGLIIIEDLGTAVLIGLVGMVMLLAGGARIWQLAMLIPVAVGGVFYMIISSPYRVKRLTTFLNPYADADGAGYQPIQMMAAISDGGRGLGNGVIKQGYLPADTTDGVFAIIVEEMGIGGAALVVGLLLVMLWTMFGVARDCRFAFGRLLAIGTMLMVGIQAVMNIAVVTVVVPTKGIALPLLSAGGTGWVMTAGAIGLVVAIDRINQIDNEVEALVEEPSKPRQSVVSISASNYPAT